MERNMMQSLSGWTCELTKQTGTAGGNGMEIRIRRVKEEDDRIGQFIHDEFLSYSEQNDIRLDYDEFCFIAENEESQIIGVVTGHAYYNEIHISDLVVDRKERKNGVGSRLIETVENAYKDKRYEIITLATFGFQAPDFYQKLGYTIEFIRKNKDPKLDKYFMSKENKQD